MKRYRLICYIFCAVLVLSCQDVGVCYRRNNDFDLAIVNSRQLSAINNSRSQFEKARTDKIIDTLQYSQIKSEHSERIQLMIFLTIFLLAAVAWGFYNTMISKKLRKMNLLAKESEEMKKSFIQSMCHEIRTPLNHISGFSQAIVYGGDSITEEEKHQYGNIIERSTEDLTKLLDQIIEVSELDSSQTEFPMEQVDINGMGKELLDSYAWKDRNRHLAYQFNNELPTYKTIESNNKYLRTQIDRLLDNAVKFTKEGSVTLRYYLKDGHLMISVKDTGVGIPKELHEKVFDKFFKVDSFHQGSGLGLYLVRLISVKLHNKVYVNPDYTGGTEMIIDMC